MENKRFDYVEKFYMENWGGDGYGVLFSEDHRAYIKEECKILGISAKRFAPGKHSTASFINVSKKNISRNWIAFNINKFTEPIAVHECFHAIFNMMGYKGLILSTDSEEAYAYNMEHMFEQVMKIYKRAKAAYAKHKKELKINSKKSLELPK